MSCLVNLRSHDLTDVHTVVSFDVVWGARFRDRYLADTDIGRGKLA
jgi:hypothetical protein